MTMPFLLKKGIVTAIKHLLGYSTIASNSSCATVLVGEIMLIERQVAPFEESRPTDERETTGLSPQWEKASLLILTGYQYISTNRWQNVSSYLVQTSIEHSLYLPPLHYMLL